MKREEALAWVLQSIESITDMPREEIREESLLIQELDMSSLEIMNMAAEMEKITGSPVPTREIRGFIRVRDMVDYLESI